MESSLDASLPVFVVAQAGKLLRPAILRPVSPASFRKSLLLFSIWHEMVYQLKKVFPPRLQIFLTLSNSFSYSSKLLSLIFCPDMVTGSMNRIFLPPRAAASDTSPQLRKPG